MQRLHPSLPITTHVMGVPPINCQVKKIIFLRGGFLCSQSIPTCWLVAESLLPYLYVALAQLS